MKHLLPLLIAGGLLVWVFLDIENESKTSSSKNVLCSQCELDKANRFTLDIVNVSPFEFEKIDGVWWMKSPIFDMASPSRIYELEKYLRSSTIIEKIEKPQEGQFSGVLARIGWNGTWSLKIGGEFAMDGNLFAQTSEGNAYVIDGMWNDVFLTDPLAWIDDFVFANLVDRINGIRLRWAGNQFSLQKQDSQWFLKPQVPAELSQVKKYLLGMSDFRARNLRQGDISEKSSVFMEVTLASGQSIQFRGQVVGKEVYIHRSDRNVIFVVDLAEFEKMMWQEDYFKISEGEAGP
ncbi:MAG: DUF4340 domain-containing protein [Bdellovibrionales bacterium]